MGDPLDDWLRSGLDAVPVPSGLRERIGAAVGRRGIWKLLAVDAAAVLLAIAAWTGSGNIRQAAEPLAAAPARVRSEVVMKVSLATAPAEPLEISDSVPGNLVYIRDDRMILEFERSDR